MKQVPAHKTLRRLFDVIVGEAERNSELARELVEAIGQQSVSAKAKRVVRKDFDRSEFHAVNILRQHGESALRGKLEQIRTVDDLRSVAKLSGLVLSGGACRTHTSRADLISGIIAAAKHYDAQRRAASS